MSDISMMNLSLKNYVKMTSNWYKRQNTPPHAGKLQENLHIKGKVCNIFYCNKSYNDRNMSPEIKDTCQAEVTPFSDNNTTAAVSSWNF